MVGSESLGALSAPPTVRSAAILLGALLLLPAAFATTQPVPPTEAFLVIRLDQLEFATEEAGEGAAAWEPVSVEHPLTLRAAPAPDEAPAVVALPVDGIHVFGFDATIQGAGVVQLLVDGAVLLERRAAQGPIDVRLDGLPHELAWRFVPGAEGDVATVALHGARALVAPRAHVQDTYLFHCSPGDIWIYVDFALPLDSRRVIVVLDGHGVTPNVYSDNRVGARYSWLRVQAPLDGFGSIAVELGLDIQDQLGKVWPAEKKQVNYTVIRPPYFTPQAGPHGWNYNEWLGLHMYAPWCDDDAGQARLWVNDVEIPVKPGRGGAGYGVGNDLPYGDTYRWRWEVTEPDGREHTLEGVVRHGLDTMELELAPGTLDFTVGETTTYTPPEGMSTWHGGPIHGAESTTFVTNVPYQLRATYVPHAISCRGSGLETRCDPFGARPPGLDEWQYSALALSVTLTTSDGWTNTWTIAGAGQFAAASAMSSKTLDALRERIGNTVGGLTAEALRPPSV